MRKVQVFLLLFFCQMIADSGLGAMIGLRDSSVSKISPPQPISMPNLSLSLWCEFLPYDQVTKTLPVLAKQNVSLLLHVRPEEVGREDLATLIRSADTLGVEVKAWLLLPEEEKRLYLCEATFPEVRQLALHLVTWIEQEKLPLRWLVFDCEPTPDFGQELWRCVRGKHGLRLASYLRQQKNREQFRTSAAHLCALINQLHSQGFRVVGATNRILLEALRYQNVTLEDCLGIPFTMIPWDQVTFLSYRYGATQNDYMAAVRRYATLAYRYFGTRASLDLGLIGDQRQFAAVRKRAEAFGREKQFLDFYHGMQTPKDLADVMEVAKRAGLKQVNLYSLDGALLSDHPLAQWLRGTAPSPKLHASSGATTKLALEAALLQAAFKLFVHQDRALMREFPMPLRPSATTEKN